MHKADNILSSIQLKKTTSRRDILQIFVDNHFAISQSFLEDELKDLDRVTIYRTLNTFESKGLIHKIKGTDGEVKYAYCSDHCHDGLHDDEHLHFTCDSCDKTFCIEQIHPNIQLPEGYHISKVSILIEGVCNHCQ